MCLLAAYVDSYIHFAASQSAGGLKTSAIIYETARILLAVSYIVLAASPALAVRYHPPLVSVTFKYMLHEI